MQASCKARPIYHTCRIFLREDTGLQCHLHTFMSIQQNTFRINWPTFIKPGINTTLLVSSTSFRHLIPCYQWWSFVRLTRQRAMLALHGTLVEGPEIKIGSRIKGIDGGNMKISCLVWKKTNDPLKAVTWNFTNQIFNNKITVLYAGKLSKWWRN